MNQLPFNGAFSAPPHSFVVIIHKLLAVYKLWHEYASHIPKSSRYTIGAKVDNCLIEVIELSFIANYSPKEQKWPWVQKTSNKLDIIKLFLRLMWEVKALDNKKYICLSEKLGEVGRMLGGWLKQTQKETPPHNKQGGE